MQEPQEEDNSLRDMFKKEAVIALRVGMTTEQYYDEDPELFEIYAEAFKLQLDDDLAHEDFQAWMVGYYTLKAVQQSLTTKHRRIFPKGPELTAELKKQNQKSDEDNVMRSYSNFLAAVLNNGMTLQ